MNVSGPRSPQLAVATTCVIAAVCFAGSVTQRALLGFVLPGVVIAAAVLVASLERFHVRSSLGASVGLGLAWAEIANLATGLSNGPAARSTFAAAALTALAVVAATCRFPALFLGPLGGIVLAAVLLGAGDEVPIVAMLTCGGAVVALASVESAGRRWSSPAGLSLRTRRWSVVVLAGLVMAVASAGVLTQAHHDPRAPHAAVGGVRNSDVRPAFSDPFPVVRSSATGARHSANAVHQARPHRAVRRHHVVVWALILLGLLLLAAVALCLRLALSRRAWAELRRNLSSSPPDGVVGAWIWTGLRFRACRIPLPRQLSPDRVDRGGPIHDVPLHTAEPLRELGRLVTPVAFAVRSDAGPEELDIAWRLSDAACSAAEASLGKIGRIRLRLVSPPAVSAGSRG